MKEAGQSHSTTARMRARMELAVEQLIAALDRIDGDPDVEMNILDEPHDDDELDDDRDALNGLCDWPDAYPTGPAGVMMPLEFDGSGQRVANNMMRRIRRTA